MFGKPLIVGFGPADCNIASGCWISSVSALGLGSLSCGVGFSVISGGGFVLGNGFTEPIATDASLALSASAVATTTDVEILLAISPAISRCGTVEFVAQICTNFFRVPTASRPIPPYASSAIVEKLIPCFVHCSAYLFPFRDPASLAACPGVLYTLIFPGFTTVMSKALPLPSLSPYLAVPVPRSLLVGSQ